MAPKATTDANLLFLYVCFQNSDFNSIDWQAVGAATNLNVPAARMRYTRLKKLIESDMNEGNVDLKRAEPSEASEPSESPAKKPRATRRKKTAKADDGADDNEIAADTTSEKN